MLKAPRYLREYANDKIRSTKKCDLMCEDIRAQIIAAVGYTVRAYERGNITIDEAMMSIAKPL